MTPFFSSASRAGCVTKRFAPSTRYLKFVTPSESQSLDTFVTLTDSGRPPQGT